MVQTAGNNAQLNETRGAERPPSSPISPAFFINFDVVTRAPSANLAAMSNGRLARFVGAVFVAAVVVAGPGTAAVAHATPAASVGVYPPLIHFDQALRGGEFLDTFGVLNDTGQRRVLQFRAGGRNGALAAPGFLGQSRHRHHEDLGARRPAQPRPSWSSRSRRLWPTVSTAVKWQSFQPRRKPPARAKRRSGWVRLLT